MMKKFLVRMLLAALITVVINSYVKAQTDPGDPGDDPDKVPLDPGSWILVAAGAGYGLKKLRDAKRAGRKNDTGTTAFIREEDRVNNH